MNGASASILTYREMPARLVEVRVLAVNQRHALLTGWII